jgi:predicted Fe-Mo cluster-binding NifX family protein
MKIAISATGPGLDAEVEPRFGRCPYFIIVDPETMQFEAVENSSAMASGGAGISSGQMIAGKGAQAVLTGNCGPNANQVLSAAGLQIITGVSGKIQDAIQTYKAGEFQAISQPTVESHFGMGGGAGAGMGRGRGRGMGMGQDIGAGMMPGVAPSPWPAGTAPELKALKAQLQALGQQLSDVQRHIEELEKRGHEK